MSDPDRDDFYGPRKSLGRTLVKEVGKHYFGKAITFVILIPIGFAILWVTMPRMINGPDSLLYVVTVVIVTISAFGARYAMKVSSRVFDGPENRDQDE